MGGRTVGFVSEIGFRTKKTTSLASASSWRNLSRWRRSRAVFSPRRI